MAIRTSAIVRMWLPLAVGVVGIAVFLFLENIGGGILNRVLLQLPGIDKALHGLQSFVVFCLLLWMSRALPLTDRARYLSAAAGTIGFAIFDEVQQGWQSERNVDAADIVAGTGGVLVGLASTALRGTRGLAASVVLVATTIIAGLSYDSYLEDKDYHYGLLLAGQGRMAEARLAYLRAHYAGVSHANLYNSLAWASVESGEGDPAAAVAYAQQSLAMRPNDPDTLDTYGWALYHAGRIDDAVGPLQQALSLKPSIYCIHYHLGVVQLRRRQLAAARRHLETQVAQFPRTKEARLAAELIQRTDWIESGTLPER